MIQWRSEGVVRDSDEEDELDLGVGSPVPVDDRDHTATPYPISERSAEGPGLAYAATSGRDAIKESSRDRPDALLSNAVASPRPEAPPLHEDSGTDELQLPWPPHEQISASQSEERERSSSAQRRDGRFRSHLSPAAPQVTLQSQLDVQEKDASDMSDVPSSPLSEPPEFIRSPWQSQDTQQNDARLQHEAQRKDDGFDDIEDAIQRELDSGYARSFRKRNPIQLHPYLLENEIYRNSLRARGLRPVYVAQGAPLEDTQNYETQSVDGSSQTFPSSSVPGSSSPMPGAAASQGSPVTPASDADDFPDLAALLRPGASGEVRNGFKRQRTGVAITGGPAASDVATSAARDEQGTLTNSRPQKVKRKYKRRFRFPPVLERDLFPSPQRTSVNEHNDSKGQPAVATGAHNSDADDDWVLPSTTPSGMPIPAVIVPPPRSPLPLTSSSSSDSEAVEDASIRHAQKRIRGVLPASWFKLDMNKEHSKPTQRDERQTGHSPSKTQLKGVARKVPRAPGPSSQANHLLSRDRYSLMDIPDDSEDDVQVTAVTSAARDTDAPDAVMLDDEDHGSIVEEDYIDPMLQSAKRSHGPYRRSRKRQTRLTDAFRQPLERHYVHEKKKTRPQEGQASVQSRSSNGVGRRRKRRTLVPRMSVLDVPEEAGYAPTFVKIAKRQARSRADRGRHSPTRKILSLSTQQDGADVDNVLRDWRQGRLEPSRFKTQPTPSRPPLSDLSSNGQHRVSHQKPSTAARDSMKPVQTPLSTPTQPKMKQPHLRPIPMVILDPTDDPFAPRATPAPSRKHIAKKQTQMMTDLVPLNRQGQLEELESEHDLSDRRSAFHKNLMRLNRMQRNDPTDPSDLRNPSCNVYQADPVQSPNSSSNIRPRQAQERPRATSNRQRRKRRPRWIDLGQVEHHQPFEQNEIRDLPPSSADSIPGGTAKGVQGLAPFGSQYTTDFGIGALPVGVCFRQATFIGRGGLMDALALRDRDMDLPGDKMLLETEVSMTYFGPWTEDVAGALQHMAARVISTFNDASQRSPGSASAPNQSDLASNILTRIITYLSKALYFLDPIDRRSCVATLSTLISNILSAVIPSLSSTDQHVCGEAFRTLTQLFLVSFQTAYVARHATIDPSTRTEADAVVQTTATHLNRAIFRRSDELFAFHDQSNIRLVREYGIRGEASVVEAIVVLFHGLRWKDSSSPPFWALLGETLLESISPDCDDIRIFERVWHFIFAVIPLLEINAAGILKAGSRSDTSNIATEDCSMVRLMLARTLELYSKRPGVSTINAYMRSLLGRCHRLVQMWGWRKCEPLLHTAFDFFAQNGLHLLLREDTTGSCRFLETLDAGLPPQVNNSDCSFHVFLKLLAAGLVQLRQVHPAKKMKNIVWRFVPNHGRMHNKDEELKSEDLDALRNHHDLLTVLYYAAPAGMRPQLSLLRNLVDFKYSHTEVCRLNVRAWANLARYQASTDELPRSMEPFKAWLDSMIDGCVTQHRSARTEAEAFVQSRLDRGQIVSRTAVDSTVAANQRNVEAVLQMIVDALRHVLDNAWSAEAAKVLFERSSVSQIFSLFDDKRPTSFKTITQSLACYDAYFAMIARQRKSREQSQQASEDSQDYGDWPSDEEIDADTTGSDEPNGVERAAEELQSWMSNAFGAESPPDSTLLSRTIASTLSAASLLVNTKRRDWSFYLDAHGRGSWQQLRDTNQTRKFGPEYLASILELDRSSFGENRTVFISGWLVSLVERESMLKFQHRLTSALLNAEAGDPILANLPFAVTGSSPGRYDISLDELRERRVSLISCVLSNIHRCYELDGPRESYRSIVKSLMDAMKKHHQELQASSSTRGAYVDFVQTVVQFLQQYTADICPVDKFFTDSSAFPLPTADPEYIVGRLRAYHLKSRDKAAQKKLAMFVQTACERAAAEQQQGYLADQLSKSVQGIFEESASGAPSLRQLLLGAIFPAYIKTAGTTRTGWILAKPAMAATQAMLDDALLSFDLQDSRSLASAGDYVTALAFAASEAASSPAQTSSPEHARVQAQLLHLLTSALPLLDFLARSGAPVAHALDYASYFCALASRLSASGAHCPPLEQQPPLPPPPSSPLADVRAFAERELADALARAWAQQGDAYTVARGGRRQVVPVDMGSLAAETAALRRRAAEFVRVAQRMPALRSGACGGGDGDGDGDGDSGDRDMAVADLFL